MRITAVQLKLQDAATQIKLAIANSEDEHIFRSCINSYISLAPSVTLVMETQSSDPALRTWYKNQMETIGGVPLLRFFNSSIRSAFTASTEESSVLDPYRIQSPRQTFARKFQRMENPGWLAKSPLFPTRRLQRVPTSLQSFRKDWFLLGTLTGLRNSPPVIRVTYCARVKSTSSYSSGLCRSGYANGGDWTSMRANLSSGQPPTSRRLPLRSNVISRSPRLSSPFQQRN
jgi:hypothetical protein